jgi:hypothetical protein
VTKKIWSSQVKRLKVFGRLAYDDQKHFVAKLVVINFFLSPIMQ